MIVVSTNDDAKAPSQLSQMTKIKKRDEVKTTLSSA